MYAELNAKPLAGVRYQSHKLPDGVSFLHLAAYGGEGDSPLAQLASFKTFIAGIRERCDEPPVNQPTQMSATSAAQPEPGCGAVVGVCHIAEPAR